jgi:hypothetical protein
MLRKNPLSLCFVFLFVVLVIVFPPGIESRHYRLQQGDRWVNISTEQAIGHGRVRIFGKLLGPWVGLSCSLPVLVGDEGCQDRKAAAHRRVRRPRLE